MTTLERGLDSIPLAKNVSTGELFRQEAEAILRLLGGVGEHRLTATPPACTSTGNPEALAHRAEARYRVLVE
jgi:hypothetical protein